jgi:hypothetical protein
MSDSSLTFLPWLRSGLGAIHQPGTGNRKEVSVAALLVDENNQSQILDAHDQPLLSSTHNIYQ